MNRTAAAISHLQRLLSKRFGNEKIPLNHDSGQSTISVSNSRVELTDEGGSIVARGPVRVAKVLRTRRVK